MSQDKQISTKGLANSSKFLLIGNIIGKLSTLVLIPIYSWLISPADFGVIFTIQTVCALLLLVVPLSVDVAISRLYFNQEKEDQEKVMFSSVIICLTLASIIIYSVLLSFEKSLSLYLDLNNSAYLKLGILYCFFGQFFPVSQALLLAKGQAKGVAITVVSSNVILVIANVLFVVYLEDKILGYTLSYVAFYFAQFIAFFIVSHRYFILKFDFKLVKEVYSYSLQFLLTNISSWIVALCDRLMLLKMKGSVSVGLYSTGYSIASAPNVIVNSINQAFVPYTYSIFNKKEGDGMSGLTEVMTTLFIGYSLLFFGVIFFVEDLVHILGPKYRESEWVIKIVVMAYFFNALKLIIHNPMSFKKEMVKYKSLIWLVTAILNVGLNIYFIPDMSYNGAALATLLSFSITLVPVLILSQKAIFVKLNLRVIAKVILVLGLIFALQYFPFMQLLAIKIISFLLVVIYLGMQSVFVKKYVLRIIK